jgi:Flp pilus assembly protein TadG
MITRESIMKPRRSFRRDERGQSISLFVLVIMGALIITSGLVIDGGQKVAATSRAESAAAGASRAAGNAAATQELGGADPASAAVLAAKTYLAGQPGVEGTVSITNGVVLITTSAQQPTIFLSIIGIGSVSGQGSARANIVPTGDSR